MAARYTHIQGLSDERRLTRAGKLRIGRKVTKTRADGSEYEAPEKLDHFAFHPTDPRLLQEFEQLYGAQPKSLPVMLPHPDRAVSFPQSYQRWQGGHLWCEGDNQTAWRVEVPGGDGQEIPCSEECPFRIRAGIEDREERKRRTCRPVGQLRVLLWELPGANYYEIQASQISIVRINSCLDLVKEVHGQIHLVPLVLKVVPAQIRTAGQRQTVYVLELDIAESLAQLAARRNEAAARLPAGQGSPELVGAGDGEEADVDELGEDNALGEEDPRPDPDEPEDAEAVAGDGEEELAPTERLFSECMVLLNQLPPQERIAAKHQIRLDLGQAGLQQMKQQLEARVRALSPAVTPEGGTPRDGPSSEAGDGPST